MKLSDLMSTTDVVQMTYGTFHLTLTVNSAVVTTEFLTELTLIGKPAKEADAVVAQLSGVPAAVCKLIAAWDLQDDDEKPYPLTPEEIGKLPLKFLMAVIQAATGSLGEASAPTSGATSDATSLPAAG